MKRSSSMPRSTIGKSLSATALALAAMCLSVLAGPRAIQPAALQLGDSQRVAPGVQPYRVSNPALLDPPGPVSGVLLRLDPTLVDLRVALAHDRVGAGAERVADIAKRHGAIAAVNAGFFIVATGDPAGVLKIDGELVSLARRARGAVGFTRAPPGRVRLLFDRIRTSVRLRWNDHAARTAEVDALNQPLTAGRLVAYTPRYEPQRGPEGEAIFWIARGSPLTLVDRQGGPHAPAVPADGIVLASAGQSGPALASLELGAHIDLVTDYETKLGSPPDAWAQAADIVGGAGLLVYEGSVLDDWRDEQFRAGFDTERHPRTMIGVDGDGAIWLAAIDGRQPAHSVGMSFTELQRLAAGLGLVAALNLDGGGSTTMVVGEAIVNRPSDESGPRPVSDALVVVGRP